MGDNNNRRTYFLLGTLLFLGILVSTFALESEDIDDICSEDNHTLFRWNGTWVCANLMDNNVFNFTVNNITNLYTNYSLFANQSNYASNVIGEASNASYVPYTGATGDVDLNLNYLSRVERLNFSSYDGINFLTTGGINYIFRTHGDGKKLGLWNDNNDYFFDIYPDEDTLRLDSDNVNITNDLNVGGDIKVEGSGNIKGLNVDGFMNGTEIAVDNNTQPIYWFREGGLNRGAFFYNTVLNRFGFGRYPGGSWGGYQWYWNESDGNISFENDTQINGNLVLNGLGYVYDHLSVQHGNGQIVQGNSAGSMSVYDDNGQAGSISFGNTADIGISRDGLVDGYDYDGGFIFKQKTSNPDDIGEFIFIEENGNWRFALPKSGTNYGTYNPRSMIIAGPSWNNASNFNCSYWGFDNLKCDTGGVGADLGVQNDLQVLNNTYIEKDLEVTGNINGVNITSNATDVLFDFGGKNWTIF